ncbi:MAG: thioredoxin [Candidatus Pacearchaeota archaeon]
MSGEIKDLNEDNFDDFISKGNVIVDFWAEWCGPCKMLKPVLEEFAKENKGKIKIGKVNVENEHELADRFMVMAVPALAFFKDGEQIDMVNGAISKEELKEISDERF